MSTVGSLGELIFAARTARGWTIEEAASRIGRTHTWLWRIEKGKNANPPSPGELRDIGKVLGLSSLEMLEALGYLDPPQAGHHPNSHEYPDTDIGQLQSFIDTGELTEREAGELLSYLDFIRTKPAR